MKRLTCAMSLLGFLAASALAGAADDKTPTIKEVMQKLHKGANSPLASLKKSMASGSPDWSSIQDTTKDFVILGAALAKNDPPKGDKESYKKLADAYFTNAKAMDDAAKKESATDAKAAFAKVATSCMACHRAHRP